MPLNYSSFMQLLKEHYLPTTTAEQLARSILEVATDNESNPNFVDSTYLSRIWTGERDIAKEIREDCNIPSHQKALVDYFKIYIVDDLVEALKEDFYDRLFSLINNDPSISETKKNSFRKQYNSGDEGKFLANVFLYAISKPNKGYVSKLDFDDGELFEEVDQRCPYCNEPLTKKVSGVTRYFFSVVRIFPEVVSPAKAMEFSSVHPEPIDPSNKVNKICLCNSCAASYLYNPTVEVYERLYTFKKRALKNKGITAAASTRLDEEIKSILGNLKESDIEADSFKKLRMKPLKVVNKIRPENRLLIKAIKDDNDAYYNYIKESLSQLDSYKISFRKVAHEVADCFLSLSQVTEDQDDIYNGLIQWILDTQMLPESYRNAAHIVISFFVQNCEVFDEIPE